DPFSLLIINNLTDEEGGVAGSSKVGRGLQQVLSRCALAFTPADLHVFAVLGRTLRFTARDPESSGGRLHKLVSIYRGAAAAGELHCSSSATRVDTSVIHPVFGNQKWTQPAPTACWKGGSGCVSEVTFSFAERLQGTSWLRP